MSKMDRIINSKNEKESIYEIYRACRLCGGGAGYKMPIIQNIIDLDEADVELKLKIRECVQIEVHQDDKMPPLICELCVDKVNDFYEFLEMCRQTNKKTRFRLGLPPQSLPRGAPDAGDCILGLTEPVYVNEDSDGEPLSRHKKQPKVLIKKEPVVRIKVENLQEERSSRQKKRVREKTPPRVTRQGVKSNDDIALSNLKKQDKPSKPGPQSSKTTPKSILKKENSVKSNSSEDTSLSRLKRSRDKEVVKLETPTKKVKVTIKPSPAPPPPPKQSPKTPQKPEPKPVKQKQTPSPVVVTSPKKTPLPPNKEKLSCDVCGQQLKTLQAFKSHLKTHSAQFTSPKLACNPCGDWFNTPDEASLHHRRHKYKNMPYYCTKCDTDFKTLDDYDGHIKDNDCIPLEEVPDVKCEVCWHLFPTNNLYENHKCLGEHNRPGGDCYKCKKSFVFLKTLKKHQATCVGKKKDKLNISKKLLKQLKPMQVRIMRCDSLLHDKEKYCDVSFVSKYYGLDPNCYYPYISGLRIKSEFSGMVDIRDDIKNVFFAEDYVHWDSEQSDSEDEITCNIALNPSSKRRHVDTLTALALKTIFSPRLIGKVPRKKRKVKPEKVFDSLMADEDEVRMDINDIINNLGEDNDDESKGFINKINNSYNDSVSINDSDKIVSFNDDTSNNDEVNDTTSVDSVDLLNNFNDSTDDNNVCRESVSLQNESNDSAKKPAANDDNVNDSNTINNESRKSESLQNENNDSATNNVYTNSITDTVNKNDHSESVSKLESVSNNINSKLNDNDSIESRNIESNDANNKKDIDSNDAIDQNDSTHSKIVKDIDCPVNDKLVNNDKLPLDDLLSNNAGSNVGLGINDFSFDY